MNNVNIEQTIIRNVICNDTFMRKVLPFLKVEYFEGVYKNLFKELGVYVSKYNKLPSQESFKIEIDDSDKFNEDQYTQAMDALPSLFTKEDVDENWLLDRTEKFCQDKAVYNAVMESITIIDGKHASATKQGLGNII